MRRGTGAKPPDPARHAAAPAAAGAAAVPADEIGAGARAHPRRRRTHCVTLAAETNRSCAMRFDGTATQVPPAHRDAGRCGHAAAAWQRPLVVDGRCSMRGKVRAQRIQRSGAMRDAVLLLARHLRVRLRTAERLEDRIPAQRGPEMRPRTAVRTDGWQCDAWMLAPGAARGAAEPQAVAGATHQPKLFEPRAGTMLPCTAARARRVRVTSIAVLAMQRTHWCNAAPP